MENSHKVRLSDIAEKLNVSTVTVSKAIADKEGVSNELREKIKRMAIEMGYRQKIIKQSPIRPENSTGNIGIIIPSRFFSHSTSFYWNMYNALSKELQNNGYYAILEQLDSQSEFDLNIPGVIRDNKVDGVILLGQVSLDYAHYFSRNYQNFIFLDFYINEDGTDSVTTDNFYSEYIMTEYLISQGHRDIRYVGNFSSTTSITDRYMGFAKAMLEIGQEPKLLDIIDDRNSDGLSIPITLPSKMPTAFVCNCDETAVRLIKVLNQNGYKVPDDISVVGFDNYVGSGPAEPPLTTVEVDSGATARSAVDILLKKISGQPYIKGHTVVGGKLIIRDSVKKVVGVRDL